jgi:hypothetical protein
MTSRSRLIVMIWAVASLSLSAQPSTSIQGVWRVVEQTINNQTLADEKLGLGFHIYTEKYYAVVRESGTPPRPDPRMRRPRRRHSCSRRGGLSWRSSARMNSLATDSHTIIVAKNPDNMRNRTAPGSRFKLEGDTLITEPYGPRDGRTIALKMVRVE